MEAVLHPQCNWRLPVCCPFCKEIITAITIDEIASKRGSNHIKLRALNVTRFDHDVQKAKGDPSNIMGWLAAIFYNW